MVVASEATGDPAEYSSPTMAGWNDRDSTTISADDEDDAPPPAQGGFHLAQLYLLGRVPLSVRIASLIAVILWAVILSWLFIQDNAAGNLKDVAGLQWFGVKAAAYSAVYLVVAGMFVMLAAKRK